MKQNTANPKVSCIICSLNSEKYIKRCVDSIVNQVDEIILVDASSNDKTIEIVNNIKKKNQDPNKIKIYNIPRDKPTSYARNYGAKLSKHGILLIADSDVDLDPKWVETALKTLISKGYASIGGRTVVEGQTITRVFLRLMRHKEVLEYPYPTRSIMITKKDYLEAGGFKELKLGDEELLYKTLIKKGKKSGNIMSIYETHLGEPTGLIGLLKRQAKYGRFSYLERTPKYSMSNLLLSLIMILPFGALYSFKLYYILFKDNLEDKKNIVFFSVASNCHLFIFCSIFLQ